MLVSDEEGPDWHLSDMNRARLASLVRGLRDGGEPGALSAELGACHALLLEHAEQLRRKEETP
ncbi:MAG: hypothetical protein HY814_11100 [Candidatus Riflebacteria bacterium]|nr:hypothetical protein [Candidatus Riflebacteria bacterium]